MKAKELRIGNYLYDNEVGFKSEFKVTALDIGDIYKRGFDTDYSYISITKEWLLKLGFEEYKSINNSTFKIKANKYLSLNDEKQGYLKIKKNSKGRWMVSNFANNSIIIQYIHQIQNLYFAITQKELIINR